MPPRSIRCHRNETNDYRTLQGFLVGFLQESGDIPGTIGWIKEIAGINAPLMHPVYGKCIFKIKFGLCVVFTSSRIHPENQIPGQVMQRASPGFPTRPSGFLSPLYAGESRSHLFDYFKRDLRVTEFENFLLDSPNLLGIPFHFLYLKMTICIRNPEIGNIPDRF